MKEMQGKMLQLPGSYGRLEQRDQIGRGKTQLANSRSKANTTLKALGLLKGLDRAARPSGRCGRGGDCRRPLVRSRCGRHHPRLPGEELFPRMVLGRTSWQLLLA